MCTECQPGAVGSPPDCVTTDAVAATAGDRVAFARLAQRHDARLRRTVLAEIRWRDDVDDCVQEALTRALRDLHRLRDPRSFTPWLLAIARNVAVDHRRASLRQAVHDAGRDEERLERLEAIDPAPEDWAGVRSLASSLRSAMRSLPDREASALVLATRHQMSPREVAAELGVSTGNAKVIVHRARRRLRAQLALHGAVAS